MKTPSLLLAALTALLPATAAPIAVTGSMHYTQNFDVLPTDNNTGVSVTLWADDGTIPGWHFYRAGQNATGAGFGSSGNSIRVSNGDLEPGNTLMNTGWFYSMGQLGVAERALGSVPISAQGEQSWVAVFQNTGTAAVSLTNIAYNAEVLRSSQNAGNVETIAMSWKKAPTQAELLTMMTGLALGAPDFPASLATGVNANYVTGWTRLPVGDYTHTTPAAGTNVKVNESHAVNAVPPSEITILPGEHLAVRWSNVNDAGADALMGIDDLDLTFTGLDTGIAAVSANVVRSDAGTAHVPGDDTVSFDLTVSATVAVSPSGWKITAPAALAGTTGAYGVPVNVPNAPIAEFTGTAHVLTLTVVDADSAAITTPVQVVAPWCQITSVAATGFSYDAKGTASPADDEVSYSLGAEGLFTGALYHLDVPAVSAPYGPPTLVSVTAAAPGTFVTHTFTDDSDPACTASLTVFPPAAIGTNAMTLTPVPMLSLPVAVNGAIRWAVNAAAGTITQTNNPAQGDHVILSEVMNVPAGPAVQFSATLVAAAGTSSGFETTDSFALELSYSGLPFFSVLGAADADSDGRLTGTAELPGAASTSRTFTFLEDIPRTVGTVQVRITGNSNSAAETFTVSNLKLEIPQPAVTVSAASNVIRNTNNPGAADDTVSFDVTISGVNGGNGWTTTGATPASGTFGLVTLTIPAGGSSVTVRITDNIFPAAFKDVTVPLPGPYIIASFDTGAGIVPVFTTDSPVPDAAWVISGTPASLVMNGNGLLVPLKTVMSEEVSLSAVTGALHVRANLHAHDTSSGFEPADEFNAYIILDGDTANPRSMITLHDDDGSGVMTGAEICPAPAIANTVQDFDYPLSALIPAGTGKVQIVFTGLCNSDKETMTVSGITIVPRTGEDTDGDGQTDAAELVAGTDPNDAHSTLRTSNVTADAASGAVTVTWSSVPGKTYHVQSSPNLSDWTDIGSDIIADAPEESTTVPLPNPPLTGKGFLRVRVVVVAAP